MGRRINAGFKFAPFSKRQAQVLTWWIPESGVSDAEGIIADGAIRSGKTVCMALSFVQWSMATFNGENLGMCGKTVGSFRRNVLAPLRRMLPGRGYKVKEKRSENLVVISKGNTENYYYIFGGKDESSQDLIQGVTLAGVLMDEVALMPQSFVNQATGRCSVSGSKFWFNCNPGSPEHWFKKEWVDKVGEKSLLYLHFTMDDNLSLEEKIKERYKRDYTGIFFRRYVLGEWCVAEGLVYSFGEENITDEIPEEAAEYFVSIDYGTFNPFSAGLWAVTGDKAVRIKELYYNGRGKGIQLTDSEYAERLEKELIQGKKISKIIVDPSAASFIAEMRKKGYTVIKAKNDVIDGIRFTGACLKNENIKIHRSCKDAIREFGLYCWDEKATADTVVKENDHCLTEDTLVDTIMGKKRIKDLCGKLGLVWSINKRGRRCIRPFFGVKKTAENQTIYRITLKNGKTVDCTGEHRILTEKGWKEAKYLTESDKIIDISDE